MAQRQNPIIRTQFTRLAGNLPLGGEVQLLSLKS